MKEALDGIDAQTPLFFLFSAPQTEEEDESEMEMETDLKSDMSIRTLRGLFPKTFIAV